MYDMHLLTILSQLQQVQYLRISIAYMSGTIDELTENIKKIPSSSLKYLAVTIRQQSTPESIHSASQSLFAAILSLLAIDISERMPGSGTPILTRFVRQDMVMSPTANIVDEIVVEGLSRSWYGVDEQAERVMVIETDDM